MHDDSPHLRTISRPAASESQIEDDSGLPSLREGEYQPYGRASNKSLHSIHFVGPNGEIKSFQYAHLDSHSCYTATSITLRFDGVEVVRVVINGRNLWRLYDYLHQHRMPWVMQAARDFAKDGQPIVTGLAINTLAEIAEDAKASAA